MDNKLKKSLELLERFFQENTEKYIDKKISKIDNLDIDGELFESYLGNLKYHYGFKVTNSIIKENENLEDIAKEKWVNLNESKEFSKGKHINIPDIDFKTDLPSGFYGNDDNDYDLAA
jgi:hypothetical protein